MKKIEMTKIVSVLSLGLALSACNFEKDNEEKDIVLDITYTGYVHAVTPDYATSDIVILEVDEENGLNLTEGSFSTSDPSDIAIAINENSLYRIGRKNFDNISKFNISDNYSVSAEYSLIHDTATDVNPHALGFISNEKAYLVNYGLNELWIVNPTATETDDFKIGEIDLSAYAFDDMNPAHMTDIEIVDDKAFVLMQRLNGFSAEVDSYLAVIDTTNDTEITIDDTASLKGINLSVLNASAIDYAEGKLIVAAVGTAYTESSTSNGISIVDLNDYSVEVILQNNGEQGDDTFGAISSAQLVDDNIYFVSSAWATDYSSQTAKLNVYNLNDSSVTQLDVNQSGFSFVEHAIVNENDVVFYGEHASEGVSAQVILLNTANNNEISRVEMNFNPINFVAN